MPYKLLQAMVVAAWAIGWHRFAGVLLLAFHGPARIGEVLNSHRVHLVLPQDVAQTFTGRCYLHVAKPKTGNRGGAKQQHMSVTQPEIVGWISHIFGNLQQADKLYPFSDVSFRSRWDFILKALDVPIDCRITPGCLRGGGVLYGTTNVTFRFKA